MTGHREPEGLAETPGCSVPKHSGAVNEDVSHVPGPVPSALCSRPRPVTDSGPRCVCLTCKVVLWSEKGELKNVVTMLMTISVTYFSKTESACFRSLVLLQAWGR